MAPLLFSIVFSAMLHDAFKDCDKGVMIRFRSDGGFFNLKRLQGKTKTSSLLIRDLLYADDCALIAHSFEDAQLIVDNFSRACCRYGLTISIKKTEVLHQPRPGQPPCSQSINVGGKELKSVEKFCYLRGILAQNSRVDNKITAPIRKAGSANGRLQHRLWSDYGIQLWTKVQVYKTVVLSTLLYGCESWTQYWHHVKVLEQFHQLCLHKIFNMTWRVRVSNTDILEFCGIASV